MNQLKGKIYELIGWLATLLPAKKNSTKKILIVRVDEIGDYMLWRPFLKEIAGYEAYRDDEIHFCGNKSWKALFETFDKDFVHKAFWVDKLAFKTKMGYRFRFLRSIYLEGYSIVINPTFSRDKRNDDSIVKAAKAKETIGMVGNLETVRTYERGYDQGLYTRLFNHPEKPVFEFIRNRLFSEFVTFTKSTVINTKVDISKLPLVSEKIPEKYFIIFPGSRSASRIWPTEHFILVAQYLFEQFGWTAVIAGTKNDHLYTRAFAEQYPYPLIDLTGKTSLPEMLTLLQKAACLVSVDTGSVHLAVAVGCTVFGIFNGSQYRRFAPYPQELAAHFYAIYPDDLEKELENEILVKQKYEFVVDVPYASVKAEKVILTIHRHFTVTS
jgi:ADP-heptose:LPS heptosyltransferase